jgi:hypothetical protein
LKLFRAIHDVADSSFWDIKALKLIKKAAGTLAAAHC